MPRVALAMRWLASALTTNESLRTRAVTVRAGGGDGYAIYVQIHYASTRSAPTAAHRCQLPMSITS